MAQTLIFGHKNPDTDSICSALAYADLKAALGVEAEAVRLGAVNSETQFALDFFGRAAPRLVESVAAEASHVILVDHNERQQSASGIGEVTIAEVLDHHRIANFETVAPLYFRAEPVGCTATIVLKEYKEKGVAVSPPTAGLMLSAILSDTLILNSPTCTPEDVAAAEELATIAGVELRAYGLEMLRAGANVSAKSVSELISQDSKEFIMSGNRVEIAQINVTDVDDVLSRQADVEDAMGGGVTSRHLDLFLFVVTDVLDGNSECIAVGPGASAVESAFGVTLEGNRARLRGVVSRKAQIVPALTAAFGRVGSR